MVGSGASRRSGRCERDLRACTSVTRVARETCALGEALQTSRKVSRTGCSAQSVATASQARRWSEMLVQRAARSCRRRPAARKARDAQGKMGGTKRTGPATRGCARRSGRGLRAVVLVVVLVVGVLSRCQPLFGGGGRSEWMHSARSSGGSRSSAGAGAGESWNAQRNSREGGVRASRGGTGAPRGIIVATAMVMMDGEVRAVQVGRAAGRVLGCWLERSIKSICLGDASVQCSTPRPTCLPSIIHNAHPLAVAHPLGPGTWRPLCRLCESTHLLLHPPALRMLKPHSCSCSCSCLNVSPCSTPPALVENERLLCPRVCEGARQLLPFAAPTAGP